MKRAKKKRRLIIILISIILLIALVLSPPAMALWKSFALLGNIFFEEECQPLKNIEIEKITVNYNNTHKEFLAKIYLPNKEAEEAIIVYTPLVRGGLEDETLENVAETFAKLGILAIVPFEKDQVEGIIREEDGQDVISAYQFLKNLPQARKVEKIGLFGISYGVAPVMIAATDKDVQEDLKFILLLGGYYELKNVLKFASTDTFEYGENQGKIKADPYVVEIMQKSLIEFSNENNKENLYSAIDGDVEAVQKLSKEELAIYNLLVNKDAEKFEELFAELPEKVKEKIEKLSPKNYVGEIDPSIKIFIIHSPTDTYIPYTESLRFYDSLFIEQKKNTKIAIITTFGHAVPQELTFKSFFSIYFPNLRKILGIAYGIMLV